MDLSPTYQDETITIYVPKSYKQLQTILKRVYGKTADTVHWCVASSSADEYWPGYTANGKYDIYLIYNKKKNALFLWNDNPNYSYKMFNDWGDTPCRPIEDGGLTDGALQWLDEHCNENTSIYDVTCGATLANLLGDRAMIIDKNEDDLYYHDVDLYDADERLIMSEWCYSRFQIEVDEPNFAVIYNENDSNYSVAWIDNDGSTVSAISRCDNYDECNDCQFCWNNDEEEMVICASNGVIRHLDIDSTPLAYYSSIDEFHPLDESLTNIIINDCLYNCNGKNAILTEIESVAKYDENTGIIEFIMSPYFDYYDAEFDTDDVQFDDDYDSYVVTVDLNKGKIISIIGLE